MATLAAESSTAFHLPTAFAFARGAGTITSTNTTGDPIQLRPGTVRPPTLCGQEIHMPEGAPEIKTPEVRPWTGPFLNSHYFSRSHSRGSSDSVNTHGSSSRSNSARSNHPTTTTAATTTTSSTMQQDEVPAPRGSVRAQVENMEAKARGADASRPTLHRSRSRSTATRTTYPAAASQTPPEAPPLRPSAQRVPSFDAPPAQTEKQSLHHTRPTHPLRSTTVPPVSQPPPLSRSHTIPRPGRSAAFSDTEQDGPARPRPFTETTAGLRSPRMGYMGMFSSFASERASAPPPAGSTAASAREHPGRPSRSSAVHIGPQPQSQPQPGHTNTHAHAHTSHTPSQHDSGATAPGDKGRCSPGDTQAPTPATDTPEPSQPTPPDNSQNARHEPEQPPKHDDKPQNESVPVHEPEQHEQQPQEEGRQATDTEAPAGSGATADGPDAPAPTAGAPPEPSPASSDSAPQNPPPQSKRAEFKVAVESDSDTERETQQQQPSQAPRRATMPPPPQASGSSSSSSPSSSSSRPSEPTPAPPQPSPSTSKGPAASAQPNAPAGASSGATHGLRHSASRSGETPPLRHSASRGGESRDRQSHNAARKPSPPLSKPSPPPAMSAALRDMLTRRDKLREHMSELALELERLQSSIHTEEERLRVEAERARIERERQEHEQQRKAAEQQHREHTKRPSPPRGKTPGPASEWETWKDDPAAWERAQKKQEEERLRAEQLRQWAAQAKEKEERARREHQQREAQQRMREEARRRAEEEARRKAEDSKRADDAARGQRLSKLVVHAWDEYNTFWANLQRGSDSDAPLRMTTIRWPVIYIDPKFAASPELVMNLLTVHQIATFLLSPFHSQEKSHKERIRDALLRWHPDRFTGRFLNRVVESDQALVVQGLNVVTSILKSLLDRL